jgi:surface protein
MHKCPIESPNTAGCVSNVRDLSFQFDSQYAFNEDISSWDVSSATNMSGMFRNALSFNGDLSTWNTSSVVSMEEMFAGTRAFNGDLSLWDTSSVVGMRGIFQGADVFTGRGLKNWRVSQVLDLSYGFDGASRFRLNLCDWGPDLFGRGVLSEGMFDGTRCSTKAPTDVSVSPPTPLCFTCGDFFRTGQELRDAVGEHGWYISLPSYYGVTIGEWNVSLVKDFSSVFSSYYLDPLDITGWDVSSATDMSRMFANTYFWEYSYHVNSQVGLSDWDTSDVENMAEMFFGADGFDSDLGLWNTAYVVNMSQMFLHVTAFTGKGLDPWRVPKVADLTRAFTGSTSFRANLCGWGLDLFGRSVLMADLFSGTDCLTNDTSPDLSVVPVSPLCFPCENPGTPSPSVVTTVIDENSTAKPVSCFESEAQLFDALSEFFYQTERFFSEIVNNYGWPMNNCEFCLLLDIFQNLTCLTYLLMLPHVTKRVCLKCDRLLFSLPVQGVFQRGHFWLGCVFCH